MCHSHHSGLMEKEAELEDGDCDWGGDQAWRVNINQIE